MFLSPIFSWNFIQLIKKLKKLNTIENIKNDIYRIENANKFTKISKIFDLFLLLLRRQPPFDQLLLLLARPQFAVLAAIPKGPVAVVEVGLNCAFAQLQLALAEGTLEAFLVNLIKKILENNLKN